MFCPKIISSVMNMRFIVCRFLVLGFLLASVSTAGLSLEVIELEKDKDSASILDAQTDNQKGIFKLPSVRIITKDGSVRHQSAQFSYDINDPESLFELIDEGEARLGVGEPAIFNQASGVLQVPAMRIQENGECGIITYQAILQSGNSSFSNFSLENLRELSRPATAWVPPNYYVKAQQGRLIIPVVNLLHEGVVLGSYRVELAGIDGTSPVRYRLDKVRELRTFSNHSDIYATYENEAGTAYLPTVTSVNDDGSTSFHSLRLKTVSTDPFEIRLEASEEKILSQAVAGRLSGPDVAIYSLSDLNEPILVAQAEGGSGLETAGRFTVNLPADLADDEWLLLVATEGVVLDREEDGFVQAACHHLGPTRNLVTVGDAKSGIVRLNLLSEVAYKLNQAYLDQPQVLSDKLNQIARDFLAGAGVTYEDLLAFNPHNGSIQNQLSDEYLRLLPDQNTERLTFSEAIYQGEPTAVLPALARDTALDYPLLHLAGVVREGMNAFFDREIDRFVPNVELMLHILAKYELSNSDMTLIDQALRTGMTDNLLDKLIQSTSGVISVEDSSTLQTLIEQIKSQLTGRYGGSMPYGVHILENNSRLYDWKTATEELISYPNNTTLGFQRYQVGESDIFTHIDLTQHAPTAASFAVTAKVDASHYIHLQGADQDGDILFYIIVDGPDEGTLSGRPPGIRYTSDEVGEDSFQYAVTDGWRFSNIATVSITVEENPQIPPAAFQDNYTTLINTSLSRDDDDGLMVNDTDGVPEAELESFGGGSLGGTEISNDADDTVTIGSSGSLTVGEEGEFTFVPDTGFTGEVTFDYLIRNPFGLDTATVTIRVLQIPVASDDTGLSTLVNTLLTFNSLLNNDQLGFDPASLVSFGGGNLGGTVDSYPAGIPVILGTGSLNVDSAGVLNFIPDSGFNGIFTFDYKLQNPAGTSTATVSIAVNSSPATVDDNFSTPINTTLTINDGSGDVIDNDDQGYPLAVISSFGGGSLSGSVTDNAVGSSVAIGSGSLQINADGSLSFTPDNNFEGYFTVNYRLTNSTGTSDGLISILVLNTPTATADNLFTPKDVVLNSNITANDQLGSPTATLSSFGGGSLGGAVSDNVAGTTVSLGSGGSLQVSSDGSMSFTPNTGFTGNFTFDYVISNSEGSSTATVSIEIREASAAQADSYSTSYNTVLNVSAVGILGNDSLGFPASTVSSFGGGSLGGSVTDQPVGSTALVGTGSLSVNADGSFSFTPDNNFSGDFTFDYRLSNSSGFSDATVTVSVLQPPVAVADSHISLINALLSVNTASGLLSNDTLGFAAATLVSFGGGSLAGDVDSNSAGSSVALSTDGSLQVNADGSFDYTPDTGFTGDFTFDYKISNSSGTSTATVTLTVQQAPSALDNNAGGVAGYTVLTGNTLTVVDGATDIIADDQLGYPQSTVNSFGGSDLGGAVTDNTAGTSTTVGADGSLQVNADGGFVFTPETGYTGNFQFDYRLQNIVGSSDATATVGVLLAPTAVADSATVLPSTLLTVPAAAGLLFNDTVGFEAATIASFGDGSLAGTVDDNVAGSTVTLSPGGSLTVNADGSVSFTSATGFSGDFTFDYKLTNNADSSIATVTIRVEQAPVAVDDDPSGVAGYSVVTGNTLTVTDGASDLSADDQLGAPAALITSFGGGSLGGAVTDNAAGVSVTVGVDGSLQVNGDGSFAYTPTTGFTGNFQFSYRIANSAGTSDGVVTIAVLQAPSAVADNANTLINTLLSLNAATGLLSNDTLGFEAAILTNFGGGSLGGSVDDNAAAANITVGGSGSLQVNADGSLSFTPDTGFTGNFTFNYKISNATGTAIGLATIAVQLAPTAIDNAPGGVAAYTVITGNTLNIADGGSDITGDDTLGFPAAQIASFGGGSLGGAVIDNAAGASITVGVDGSLQVNSNGSVTFTPTTGFTGNFSFVYRITNALGSSDGTVTIAVLQAPTAVADSDSVLPSTLLSLNAAAGLLSNDNLGFATATLTNFGGGSLGGTVDDNAAGASVVLSPGGSLQVNADGSLSFTGATGYTGTFTFDYKIQNVTGNSTATMSILVQQAPTAVDDNASGVARYSIVTGNTLNIVAGASDLTSNDTLGAPAASISHFGGGNLGGAVTDNAAGASVAVGTGSLQVNANGSFSFTPNTGFTGNFQFIYRVTNPAGTSAATVTIEVQQAPTAVNDTVAGSSNPGDTLHTALNTSLNSSVTGNDSLGFPAASVASFGGGDAGGFVTTNSAGASVVVAKGTIQVNSNGSFSFIPATNMTGLFTFNYRLTNSAGSSDAAVTLAVGNRPAAVADSRTAIGNVSIDTSTGTPFSVLSNDTGDQISITAMDSSSTNSGNVGNLGNGRFTYNPAPGYTGSDTFNYSVTNGFGTVNGTVTVTVSNLIWFVDNSLGASGDGRLSSPFNTLVAMRDTALDADGEVIFIHTGSGNHSGGITLRDGQKLIGQGSTVTLQSHAGIGSMPAHSASLPAVGGTAPAFTHTSDVINLGANNVIHGLSLNASAGAAIVGNGASNTTVDTTSITLSGSGSGVAITNHTGTFNHTGNITGTTSSGISFVALNGVPTINYLGAINQTGSTAVFINGTTGGGATFGGSITSSNSASGAIGLLSNTGSSAFTFPDITITGSTNSTGAVILVTNASATVNFNGDLAVTTTSGPGFLASNSGTINLSNPASNNNTISATGGAALDLSSVNLASGGFDSLSSSNSTANGIRLTAVTGVLTANGGTVSNSTNAVVQITNGSAGMTYLGNVSQANGTPLVSISGHSSGTVTFNTGTLSATSGVGLQLSNADGAYNFNGTVTLNGGDAGIDILSGSSGSFTFANTTITSPSGTAFNLDGSNATVNYNGGSITQGTAGVKGVVINNSGGGVKTFASSVGFDFDTTTANAIDLTSNSGATIHFNGTMDIDTTSGRGLNATGGGTVNVSAFGNTINTTTGRGINVSSTTIGSSGLTFQSVSVNGADNGINLSSTGSGGGLTVTGDGGGVTNGGNNSGGQLLNTTTGVSLSNAINLSLRDMRIFNSTQHHIDASTVTGMVLNELTLDTAGVGTAAEGAVNGSNITNLTVDNSLFDRGGDSSNEHGFVINELHGASVIRNSIFRRSSTIQTYIRNTQTTSAPDVITISGNTYHQHTGTFFGDNLSVESASNGNIRLVVDNSVAANSFDTGQDGVQALATSGGRLDVTIARNTRTNGTGTGFNVGAYNNSTLIFDIDNNTLTDTGSTAINANSPNTVNTTSISGRIRNNTITRAGQGGTGFYINAIVEGAGTGILEISGNNVSGGTGNPNVNGDSGIRVQARDPSNVGNLNMHVTVSGNTVAGTGYRGIEIESGSSAGGTGETICLNLFNNNSSTAFGDAGYRLRNRAGANFQLQNFVGSGASSTDITTWINSTKSNSGTTSINIGSNFSAAPGSCNTP